jgi:hypothetical protein
MSKGKKLLFVLIGAVLLISLAPEIEKLIARENTTPSKTYVAPVVMKSAEEFRIARPQMMQQMRAAIKNKDYYATHTIGEEYEQVADAEFIALWREIQRLDRANMKDGEAFSQYVGKPIVAVGMTREQVIGSQWGAPSFIHQPKELSSSLEIWYQPGKPTLSLRNGVVVKVGI